MNKTKETINKYAQSYGKNSFFEFLSKHSNLKPLDIIILNSEKDINNAISPYYPIVHNLFLSNDRNSIVDSINILLYLYENGIKPDFLNVIYDFGLNESEENEFHSLRDIGLKLIKICDLNSDEEISPYAKEMVESIKSISFEIDFIKERDKKSKEYKLYFCALTVSIIVLNSNFPKPDSNPFITNNYLSGCHWIGESLWQNDKYEIAIDYLLIAIMDARTENKLNAYNVLALCAIEERNYQLAYDVYFSWIKKENVGLISKINPIINVSEKTTVNKYKELESRIYINMGYVCAMIADEHYTDKEIRTKLLKEAISYNDTAYSLYDMNSCLTSKITYYYDLNNYEEALSTAIELNKHNLSKKDRLTSLRTVIEIIIEVICVNAKVSINSNELENLLFSYLDEYNNLYTELSKIETSKTELQEELESARYLLSNYILQENKGKTHNHEFSILLLQIKILSELIRKELQYPISFPKKYNLHKDNLSFRQNKDNKEYPTISYYTTLKSADFLFNKTCLKNGDKESKKNCLTMMHAYYMNDPNEGLTLLETLSNCIEKDNKTSNILFGSLPPVLFREQLYDEQFIFLKSFTSLVDRLNMWTMYASDRDTKSDSNGCCICVAPETFDMMKKSTYNSENKQMESNKNNDDFNLYKVVYIEDDKIQNSECNSLLESYYDKLKDLFYRINALMVEYYTKDKTININEIRKNLQYSIRFITFLFKDASYSAEKEVRLVITRDNQSIDQIHMTNQSPPKLFINPPHQVYVDQIILGPKVIDSDKWIPYYQYKLVNMWETWPEKQYDKRKPSVRKSLINYRD